MKLLYCSSPLHFSRHQLNHTRPERCKQCNKGFPSPKDLQRHDNSVHNCTVKYFCPYEGCSIRLQPENLGHRMTWGGFPRKDHWQKHMKDDHNATRQAVKNFQNNGIPMAVRKEEKWVPIWPNVSVPQVLQSQILDRAAIAEPPTAPLQNFEGTSQCPILIQDQDPPLDLSHFHPLEMLLPNNATTKVRAFVEGSRSIESVVQMLGEGTATV